MSTLNNMNLENGTKGASAGREIHDCWNKIGVRGDGSCEKLQVHTHCRNCPVYSAMALALLDRQAPAYYLDDSTLHFARANQIETADAHSAVIFRLGNEWLALPTQFLDEIAQLRAIHSLPHRRQGLILGLTGLRGELLICVSLAKMLGLEEDGKTSSANDTKLKRMVIIRHDGQRFAFPVDEVQGIHRYRESDLKAVPATTAKATAAYTKAMVSWQKKVIGCLDGQLVVQAFHRNIA